jgi:hypothetical protein
MMSLAALAAILVAGMAVACNSRPATGQTSSRVDAASQPGTSLWTLSDGGIKTALIMRLKVPPALVVLGGSRALRFQPSFIRRVTGLSAFNAAVPHATPQDEWCFANLFHRRFPTTRFRFLWIIHCDEFDEYSPGAALLEDPFLSRFLPPSFVDAKLDRLGPSANAMLLVGARQPSVIGPDGLTVSDSISSAATIGSLRQRVNSYIRSALSFYRRTPVRIDPAPGHYFAMTLRLMNDIGAKPTIVLAPLQPWYLAAIYHHGWEARHRLVCAYLRHLQRTYRFNVLDFSRLSSVGGSPTGFYDAEHLRPATARLVIDAVLRALPYAFAMPKGAHVLNVGHP